MKYLLALLVGLLLVGCGERPHHEYIEGTTTSTITNIGKDLTGSPVFVREIVISRGYGLSLQNNKIFVRCDEVGIILPDVISNSYKSGKTTREHTTIIGETK